MIISRSDSRTVVGVTSLFLIYALLIVLLLLFSNQILLDISQESFLPNLFVIPAAVILPLFLLIAIGINVLKIVRDRNDGKPGTRFKIRLIVFFIFISVLSAVPHGILAVNFIETAMNRWFFSGIIEGLKGGVQQSLDYYDDKLTSLETFGESDALPAVLRNVEVYPDSIWIDIRSLNPSILGMELFGPDGRSLLFRGAESAAFGGDVLRFSGEGMLPVENFSGGRLLRYLMQYESPSGTTYPVLFTTIVPASFSATAEQLTESLESFTLLERYQSQFKVAFLLFYAFFSTPILLIAILLSFRLSEEVIEPVVQIEEATKRVAEGDFSFRILGRTHDDLSFLVQSFNQMVSELEGFRTKILQTEKIAAWQEIARRMAHEIKNPLTPIKLSAQRIIKRYQTDPDSFGTMLEPAIDTIINEVESLNRLLAEFSDFARLPAPMIAKENLSSMIEEVISVYAGSYPRVGLHLDGVDTDIVLDVDRNQIKRAFANILKNSFDSISDSGTISIRTDLVRKGKYRYCRIQVKDTGTGIDPEHHEKVFNPYFTTKEKGTGLGLPIVERIVFDHNGRIWFESQPGDGTTFFIDLPTGT